MKLNIQVIYVQSKKIKSFELIDEMYLEKIKSFCDIELTFIKSEDIDRKNKDIKKLKETDKILQKIKSDDYVILCDENGEKLKSEQFSLILTHNLEIHKKIVFVIGGAFGVTEDLKKRAQMMLSFSSLVYNHHVAKVVLLEQIYRAFTISRGIPYHNE